MKILVCVSKTPDTTTKIAFNASSTELDSNGVQYIMNPYDEWYALVRALELKEALGGTVTLINVGPPDNDQVIRKGLAIGADDAVRIDMNPPSALNVAFQIAEHARTESYDLILLGKETIDYNGSEIGAMIAEYLDLPFVSYASKLDTSDGKTATIQRDIEGGVEEVEVDTPFVLSAAKGLAEQRIPNMKGIMMAKSKALKVVAPAAFEDKAVTVQYTLPPAKSAVKMIAPENMEELVKPFLNPLNLPQPLNYRKMVLVFAESQKGNFKKAAFEAVTYGYKTAQVLGTECVALALGTANNAADLGLYGASKVLHVADAALDQFDSQVYAKVIAEASQQVGAKVIVLSHSSTGKSIHGRLAARLSAGSVAGVNSVPTVDGGFKVKKGVFSGKAIAEYEIKSDVKVLSVMGNSLQPAVVGSAAPVEALTIAVPASRVKVKSVSRIEGIVPLPEAELVVSAGRGMKGPENWGIVEDLANVLGATTACSRPVADVHWRPHHEHVGQTGIAIRPNLYIAIGISGAIQHLAGVNNSKTIVVINKDPEAPFFKAADYGVVGDLFEVVPRLTEAFKQFKAAE